MPGAPFEYSFMDETLQKIYSTELQLKRASYTSTVLSLVIVLLGVLGLISLSIQKRTKEIGIRKVLGASVQSILMLLSTEFLKLIAIALVLAIPICWFSMHSWLQDFAYRIKIDWWVFAIAGFLALLIAFLTISLQVMKALVENPVKSLRTE